MPPTALNIGGRKFVVLPEREYRELKAKAGRNGKRASTKTRLTKQERGDIAESMRRLSTKRRATAGDVFHKMGI